MDNKRELVVVEKVVYRMGGEQEEQCSRSLETGSRTKDLWIIRVNDCAKEDGEPVNREIKERNV